MKRIIFAFLTFAIICSCTSQRTLDVKSPCVSLDDGPCGPKRSVNNWWLKNNV